MCWVMNCGRSGVRGLRKERIAQLPFGDEADSRSFKRDLVRGTQSEAHGL
jgi:hypothetical protein